MELADEGPAGREEGVLHELLGESAPALAWRAGAEIREESARDRDRVDTRMVEEVAVLGGEHGGTADGRRLVLPGAQRRPLATEDRENLGLELETFEGSTLELAEVRHHSVTHDDTGASRPRRPGLGRGLRHQVFLGGSASAGQGDPERSQSGALHRMSQGAPEGAS